MPLLLHKKNMRIDILTVIPELLNGPFDHSIIKRAKDKGLAEIHVHNIRDYSNDKHKKVDDYAFSGGAGMVMTIQPIESAITVSIEALWNMIFPSFQPIICSSSNSETAISKL